MQYALAQEIESGAVVQATLEAVDLPLDEAVATGLNDGAPHGWFVLPDPCDETAEIGCGCNFQPGRQSGGIVLEQRIAQGADNLIGWLWTRLIGRISLDPRNWRRSEDGGRVRIHDGRSLCALTLIDGHSRTCLALKVAWRINSLGVIEVLVAATCLHGIPEHIRCNNDPEKIPKVGRKWIARTPPRSCTSHPACCERTGTARASTASCP